MSLSAESVNFSKTARRSGFATSAGHDGRGAVEAVRSDLAYALLSATSDDAGRHPYLRAREIWEQTADVFEIGFLWRTGAVEPTLGFDRGRARISAASHHFSFPAMARRITSCTFIIRSIPADEIWFGITLTLPAFHPPQADISRAN
jgi:hypothetical protein